MLSLLVELYRYGLEPIPLFSWFGIEISTLDVVAMIRLCVVLRQMRELYLREHVKSRGEKGIDEGSFVKKAATTLLIVYGGEAVVGPFLGVPPSFMLSGVFPMLYTLTQAIVEYLPAVPTPGPETELPLAVVDGFTRAYLLCSLIPKSVITGTSQTVSSSPWALIMTSLIAANAGFFLTNLFSLLNPIPLSLQTPPELQAYGWMIADLWCAPTGTALYALLTHAQPFWADLHSVLSQTLGASEPVKPLDPEYARAICASLLVTLFTARSMKNFGLLKNILPEKTAPKLKSQ